jgi:hypothetical protein
VRVERVDDGLAFEVRGPIDHGLENCLMPEVNAVEIPDRHDRASDRLLECGASTDMAQC